MKESDVAASGAVVVANREPKTTWTLAKNDARAAHVVARRVIFGWV